MSTHLLGGRGVSLGGCGNISTLDVQKDRNVFRNGLNDLKSKPTWFVAYFSKGFHTSRNSLKESRVRLIAASNILRSLNQARAEGLQSLRSFFGQFNTMRVQTNTKKRVALLNTSFQHFKELHFVLFELMTSLAYFRYCIYLLFIAPYLVSYPTGICSFQRLYTIWKDCSLLSRNKQIKTDK